MITIYHDFITGVLISLRNFGPPNWPTLIHIVMYRIQSFVIKTRGWIIQSFHYADITLYFTTNLTTESTLKIFSSETKWIQMIKIEFLSRALVLLLRALDFISPALDLTLAVRRPHICGLRYLFAAMRCPHICGHSRDRRIANFNRGFLIIKR